MIVFALRHADRTGEDDLSADGETRARLLAQLLGGSGVRTAFCSSFNRAKKTLQPLKNTLRDRLTVKTATEVQEIVDGVKALPDDAVAVIVGHSDSIPDSIKRLTGKVVKIEDNEFDKLFVLLISGTESSVALGRYGKPTPV